jgi:hypothetical protein
MFSFLVAGSKLFALETSVQALRDPCDSDYKDAALTGAIPHTNIIQVHAAINQRNSLHQKTL